MLFVLRGILIDNLFKKFLKIRLLILVLWLFMNCKEDEIFEVKSIYVVYFSNVV